MSKREKGLYQKYEVKKLSNPKKLMDCIVLEFDDPIARVGIKKWAKEMGKNGYYQCSGDVLNKLEWYAESDSEYKKQMQKMVGDDVKN